MTSPNSELSTLTDISTSFIGQPIFDNNKQRYAVELMQADVKGAAPVLLDACLNNAQLMAHCQAISAQAEQYRAPVLLAITPQLLISAPELLLHPGQTILALCGTLNVTSDLLDAVKRYKRQGFRFLLDHANINNSLKPLLALVDIIRLDLLGSDLSKIDTYRKQYRRPELLWLAQKVETDAQFAACKALGCELFQGYFLIDSLAVDDKKIEPAALKLTELIRCLLSEEPDINELTERLNDEPAIVVGILKIANSPLYRKTRDVSSVKEIVTRLGLDLVRKWVLTYAVLGTSTVPSAITVLARAYSTQRIARHWQHTEQQSQEYFLAALISGSDMLFGIDSVQLLPYLNISPTISNAIVNNSGPIAQALAMVCSIERSYALKQQVASQVAPYFSFYTAELNQIQLRLTEAGY